MDLVLDNMLGISNKHNPPNYTFGNKLSKTFYSDKSAIPGPGQYQSPSTLGNKGGYLAGKPKDKKVNELPGPGAYSVRSTLTGKAQTFGIGKRSSPNLNRSLYVPGPGQYAVASDFGRRTHGVGFGTGERGVTKKDLNPGPGQYKVNENLYRDPKAASIKGRPQTSKQDLKPGPGHYQSKSMHASPAFSMGVKTKLKNLIDNNNPGPGGYDPDYRRLIHGVPGVNFGSPGKEKLVGDNMPGPGQYEVRSKVGSEAPSFGIRGRYEQAKGDMKPGPGNYNPKDDITRHSTPGTKMGTGMRSGLGMKGDNMPGPGNYDISNTLDKGKHISFGHGTRDNSLEKQFRDLPGPGQYPQQTFMGKDSQGKSILGKIKDRKPDDIPGPGQYYSPDKRNGPAYSLLGHRTDDPIMLERAKMPPPGNYNPNDSLTKYKSPNISFGSMSKSSPLRGDNAPGPGQYQIKSTLEGRGIHIAGKIPEKIIERAPGPGAYDPKNNPKFKAGPAFTMSGITGDQYIPTKDMPGPGTYHSPERPKTTGFTFGSGQRSDLGRKGDLPGPGQYQVPSRIGNEGKNVFISGRHEEKKDINQVGPGQYTLPSSLSGPKYSMGAGEKGMKFNKDAMLNPPPGAYTVDANAGKGNIHGVAFGKDKRDKTKADNLPGPGNYALPSTLKTQGITIEGRHEIKEKERAPGPGAYNQGIDPSKIHGGSVSFGRGAKSSGPNKSADPGPGTYYKLDDPKGGFTFGKDIRDKRQKGDNPGPGQYKVRADEGLTYF
jgi:hypothetical protein